MPAILYVYAMYSSYVMVSSRCYFVTLIKSIISCFARCFVYEILNIYVHLKISFSLSRDGEQGAPGQITSDIV
jgi:hypothetical protein